MGSHQDKLVHYTYATILRSIVLFPIHPHAHELYSDPRLVLLALDFEHLQPPAECGASVAHRGESSGQLGPLLYTAVTVLRSTALFQTHPHAHGLYPARVLSVNKITNEC